MPQRFEDIEESAGLVKNHVTTIQLDLMDGKYVSEKTWPFFYTTDYDVTALKAQDSSLPYWEDVNYELDLMAERPEENLDTWLGLGASRVIFHYKSIHDWDKIRAIDPVIRDFTQIGCAVTIHDNLDDVENLISENIFDFVQVMGISRVGYMGEPFEEESLTLIEKLHKKYPELTITVDGGVSRETISDLYDAGAIRFVSGSSVFGGGMASENVEDLTDFIA